MAKKARSAAQKAATRKMIAANRRGKSSRAIVPRRSSSPSRRSRAAPARGPSRRGGGMRKRFLGGFAALVKGKSVGTALAAGIGVVPDAQVIVGELQRVRLEGKSGMDALVDAAGLELFNYTGIRYQRSEVGKAVVQTIASFGKAASWSFEPFARLPYDIPGYGRAPLHVGPIDNYAAKMLPAIVFRLLKSLPIVGKIARQLLGAPNPLRRLG